MRKQNMRLSKLINDLLDRILPIPSVTTFHPNLSLPSTSVTQSDIVASSQEPEKLPSLQPRDNAPYRPLITSQNQTGRIQADRGIYCNHCWEEGHYSISRNKLVASSAQREASRLGRYQQVTRGPTPIPPELQPCAATPPGPQPGPSAPLEPQTGPSIPPEPQPGPSILPEPQ